MYMYDCFHSLRPLLLLIKLIEILMILSWSTSLATNQVIRQHCSATCGNVSIPYPFGIGEDCYLTNEPKFNIICEDGHPSGSTKASSKLGQYSAVYEVTNISLDAGELSIYSPVTMDCLDSLSEDERQGIYFYKYRSMTVGSFTVSELRNKFFVVGCETAGYLSSGYDIIGCLSICSGNSDSKGACSGNGCCQTPIPKANTMSDFQTELRIPTYSVGRKFNSCAYAFVAEEEFFNLSVFIHSNKTEVPTILDWAIGNQTCEEAPKNRSSYACKENSHCINSTNGPGYRCGCTSGYQGNPYLPGGCKDDVDECATKPNPCVENICKNKIGSYECLCKDGYSGTADRTGGGGCEEIQFYMKTSSPIISVTIGIVVSMAGFIILVSWLYWGYNKRKHMLLKKKYFERNGGLLLQRELLKKEGYTETARIFAADELKLATRNYDQSRIIGQGGFGTVYMGIQDNDPENVIAIKKAKVMDQDQIEQFINEVVVLSQINHRNVVRLLGCCLDTEVPLMVYEYINNGTLYEHLHVNKDPSKVLSWENRLRIAAEIAGVLAYLHSDASVTIVHRDIKSTNILLDQNYVAKVSDFGASRFVPLDQDQLSTMVWGTMGYLDPEYLHTGQLTEKSDVYSFGVLLVELMTGKKALIFDSPGKERCLAKHFITSMMNNTFFSIIEDSLANAGNEKQFEEIARLAMACLRVTGEGRPSMREVASELQRLLVMAMGKNLSVDDNFFSEEEERLVLGHQHYIDFLFSSSYGCNTSTSYENVNGHVSVSMELEDGR